MLKNAHTARFLKYFFNIMHGKVKKVTGNCGHIILKILSNFQLLLFKIPEVTKKITIGKFFEERDYESRNYQHSQEISILYKKFSLSLFLFHLQFTKFMQIFKKKKKKKDNNKRIKQNKISTCLGLKESGRISYTL